ncbi:uncharacterized protein [Halyomorpha halys]|uniref:uncharacterized protein isoform X2 n=1 Tax=Halyomorpha halys TaxID=286706 RepID=UPI0006D4D080|nr:uncharacterized protein LOC106687378 isoform X2 [Halyomorpha halys]XP_024215473.1 uncharacterized protein LOC106687378 isoform X2 [Halyomorpha halys]
MLQLQHWMTRKENKVLTNKVEKLKAVKLEYGRQKTELKMVLTVLEKERTKGVQLSKDIQKYQKIKTLLDGSLEESNSIINSEDSIDYDSMKICFVTMKRDFKNLTQAESKLKADYSSLFSLYKALEQTHSALVEKCSIQDRIIETYKADLKSSSNVTLPIEIPSESRMEVEEISLKTNPAKVMPRRSPRNLSKKSVFSLETKLTSTRQLTYDGLGGHSAEDKFPSAKLRPCRIVSNRRK